MNEKPPVSQPIASQEKAPEIFPSQDEIRSQFEKLCGGRPYKELRIKHDEKGVIVYEIETTDEKGEKMEYNYQRAKTDSSDTNLPSTVRFSASIHSLILDSDGMPCGGDCVANYLDGTWFPTE